jgi:hypothetical protein
MFWKEINFLFLPIARKKKKSTRRPQARPQARPRSLQE